MEENHSGQFGGHFAGKGLYKMLAQHYWWEGMYRDVHLHCRGCLPCPASLVLPTEDQILKPDHS